MTSPEPARVDELVAEWLRLNKTGQSVGFEELCSDDPDLADEVARRIDALETLQACETAVVDDLGTSATIIKTNTENDETIGTLGLQQNYRQLRFHARGGLGEIYIADDSELSREVVLKFLRGQHRNRRDSNDQFRLEAEVTARLDHPGIVPVYSFGKTPDGRFCYAMRFIQGDTLESVINSIHAPGGSADETIFDSSRALELRQLVTKLVTVCQTIAYAHNRGILHRDIKPENIMLGRFGETLVVDWGLAMAINRDDSARASGEETLMPVSGSSHSSSTAGVAIGTPAYMSPEQAAGLPRLTPSADVFSLGATLYKLLVGQAPYRGDSIRHTLSMAQAGTWIPPRNINEEIPIGLDAICRKALSANKEDRYLTALELANDLEHWLADEPIEALPDNRRQRAGRWMRKHRGPAQWIITTILLSVVSLAIVVTTRVVQSRELVQQRVEFLKTQGNFKEILIQSAFEDLLNDVRRLAGREDVRQAALAFNSLPLPAPADDRSGILDLERDIELFFREVLAQNPDYMQVRYLANDASGSEKIRIDRSRRDGPSHLKDKAELQGKRGSDYFDHTIALEQGKPGKEPVYLSDIDINRENGKRQWNFPVVRAAAPVFSQPENGKCLGIVVINMHFGHVLDKMEQAATQDVQVYLTDQKGNFLGFPDNGNRLGFHEHHDVAFCSDRGLEFSLKMLFKDLGSFISLPNDDVSILQATPNRTLFVSGRRNGPTQELQQALNQSILGGRYGNLEVEFTKYDPADAFDPETPDARANDARPMAVLEGDNWSPENITEQIAGELGHQYDLKVLPELTPSTDHALYCRKIFLSALTADGPDQADNRKRFLCLLLVLPHSASLETGVTGNRD